MLHDNLCRYAQHLSRDHLTHHVTELFIVNSAIAIPVDFLQDVFDLTAHIGTSHFLQYTFRRHRISNQGWVAGSCKLCHIPAYISGTGCTGRYVQPISHSSIHLRHRLESTGGHHATLDGACPKANFTAIVLIASSRGKQLMI